MLVIFGLAGMVSAILLTTPLTFAPAVETLMLGLCAAASGMLLGTGWAER